LTVQLRKLAGREDAVKLKLASYISTSQLPTPPTNFGWDYLVKPTAWGMLGNDSVGDRVIAGGLHETLLWRANARKTTPLSICWLHTSTARPWGSTSPSLRRPGVKPDPASPPPWGAGYRRAVTALS
jgi:hypothetical protein